MLPEDYKALKAMLEEFRKELEAVTAQTDCAYRQIREADALILALTDAEPEDVKVFSPKRGKNYDKEKIEEICRERGACEERCRILKENKAFLSRHIEILEGVLGRQSDETCGELETDRSVRRPEKLLEEKLDSLTEREKEILCQVADGMLNKEIAASLDISEQTVKNHISNIFQKLGVADRTQAAVFAIKNGLDR